MKARMSGTIWMDEDAMDVLYEMDMKQVPGWNLAWERLYGKKFMVDLISTHLKLVFPVFYITFLQCSAQWQSIPGC